MIEESQEKNVEGRGKTSKILVGIFLLFFPFLFSTVIGMLFGPMIQEAVPVLADILGWIAILGVPVAFFVGLALIVIGISEKNSSPTEESEIGQVEGMAAPQDAQVMRQSALLTTVSPEKKSSGPVAVAIVFLVFWVIMSLSTYYNMVFGSGPWTEGRVYGYFTGFLNVFWLIGCLVLILSSMKKASKRQLIIAWSLFAGVILFTILIICYHP